jgi:ABC-type multidrug transport system permease subunit
MFVYLRSSHVLLRCLYTFVQGVCYYHVCIPLFKPCFIAMFVYLRSSRMAMTNGLNEGLQKWQWRTAWTKVYKHGNNTRLERRYKNMAIYCHVCIPSFESCVIAMFVYLRSSCVLLPCLYTFVQAVCYCHVCIPSFKTWTKVYQHGNNTRLERRYTNMAITHGLNEGIQTWQ